MIKKHITKHQQSNYGSDAVRIDDFDSKTLGDILYEIIADSDQDWWGTILIQNYPDWRYSNSNKVEDFQKTFRISLHFITDTEGKYPNYPYTLEVDEYGKKNYRVTNELDNFLDCEVVALRCYGSWGFYRYTVYIQNNNYPYRMNRVGNDYGGDLDAKYIGGKIMITASEAKNKSKKYREMAVDVIQDIQKEIEKCCKSGDTYIGYNVIDKGIERNSEVAETVLRVLHDAGYKVEVDDKDDIIQYFEINWS